MIYIEDLRVGDMIINKEKNLYFFILTVKRNSIYLYMHEQNESHQQQSNFFDMPINLFLEQITQWERITYVAGTGPSIKKGKTNKINLKKFKA